jgi:hypothetical protein
MFGQKSEKRQIDNPYQGNLLDEPTQTAIEVEPKHKKDNSRQRRKAPKSRPDDCVTDSGLRFGYRTSTILAGFTEPLTPAF